MPGKTVHGRAKATSVLLIVMTAIVFGFSPISRGLLRMVNGSFAPSPYSSLSLATFEARNIGVSAGHPVAVLLSNHTGHMRTYYWTATQDGALISKGERRLGNDQARRLIISSQGTKVGRLRIGLDGTSIFITVTIRK